MCEHSKWMVSLVPWCGTRVRWRWGEKLSRRGRAGPTPPSSGKARPLKRFAACRWKFSVHKSYRVKTTVSGRRCGHPILTKTPASRRLPRCCCTAIDLGRHCMHMCGNCMLTGCFFRGRSASSMEKGFLHLVESLISNALGRYLPS